MGVQKEAFLSTLAENLFEGIEFLNMATSHDAFVENNIVHMPQSGTLPNVVKDRDVIPAPLKKRTDSNLTYTLSSFTSDPAVVQNIEELQTNYPKRASVMYDHQEALKDELGKYGAYEWAASGATDSSRIVRTSGASTSQGPFGDTKKIVVKEDIRDLAKAMDKDKVPKAGRKLMMYTDMYYELFGEDALLRKDFMDRAGLPDGVINRLFGFDIMVSEDHIPIYSNDANPVKRAVGTAAVSNDNYACIAWHPQMVAKAMGSMDVFINLQDATLYGDALSAEIMFAASLLRSDRRGIAALVQSA